MSVSTVFQSEWHILDRAIQLAKSRTDRTKQKPPAMLTRELPWVSTTAPGCPRSVAQNVLGGLLDVGLGLLGLATGLEVLVASDLSGALLDLADRFLARVLDLVAHAHDLVPSVVSVRHPSPI